MPLEGANGRLFKWCAVCDEKIPKEHRTLRIHMIKKHGLELIPGCPRCQYFRGRWSDVKKHCMRTHELDVDEKLSVGGCIWGLVKVDVETSKPTYASVSPEDICLYPLQGETLTSKQRRILGKPRPRSPHKSSKPLQDKSSQGKPTPVKRSKSSDGDRTTDKKFKESGVKKTSKQAVTLEQPRVSLLKTTQDTEPSPYRIRKSSTPVKKKVGAKCSQSPIKTLSWSVPSTPCKSLPSSLPSSPGTPGPLTRSVRRRSLEQIVQDLSTVKDSESSSEADTTMMTVSSLDLEKGISIDLEADLEMSPSSFNTSGEQKVKKVSRAQATAKPEVIDIFVGKGLSHEKPRKSVVSEVLQQEPQEDVRTVVIDSREAAGTPATEGAAVSSSAPVLAETTTAPRGEAGTVSSSAPGASKSSQGTSGRATTGLSRDLEEMHFLDPRQLPRDARFCPSVGVQTDLHIGLTDTIIVLSSPTGQINFTVSR